MVSIFATVTNGTTDSVTTKEPDWVYYGEPEYTIEVVIVGTQSQNLIWNIR